MPKFNSKSKMKRRMSAKPKIAQRKSEVTRLGSVLRALGGLGGGALGGLIGAGGTGSAIGKSLGASVSKWLGSGDYAVESNSVVSNVQRMSGRVPDMHKSDQSILVRHRELVTTVNSSIGFLVQGSYDINPGNPYLFPWLSGVAARFQEYRIHGMVFHYVPTSGTAVSSTNAALGAVMLQTTYRASDTPPSSKIEMLNEYNSNESVPCEAFCHPIECDPKENPFNIQYVRSVATPANEDKLLYDLGTMNLAVQGCQTDGNPVGDLWVTYEIELKKPVVASNITSYFSTYGAQVIAPAGVASLFAGSSTSTVGSLPITMSGNTITFPKGRVGSYQITVRLAGSSLTTMTWANTSTLVGCSVMTGPPGFTQLVTTKAGTTDAIDGVTKLLWIQILDPSVQATVTLPNPTVVGTIIATSVTVSLYNPSV